MTSRSLKNLTVGRCEIPFPRLRTMESVEALQIERGSGQEVIGITKTLAGALLVG